MKPSSNAEIEELRERIEKIEERVKKHYKLLASLEEDWDYDDRGWFACEQMSLKMNKSLMRKEIASLMDKVIRLSKTGKIKWPNLGVWIEDTQSLISNLK